MLIMRSAKIRPDPWKISLDIPCQGWTETSPIWDGQQHPLRMNSFGERRSVYDLV